MSTRPDVAFLAREAITDTRAWSGTIGWMATATARHVGEVSSLGPLPGWPKQLGRVASLVTRTAGLGQVLSGHTRLGSKVLGRTATRRAAASGPDLVLAPAASVPLASFEAPAPVVYISDATIRTMLGYYPGYSDVLPRSARTADSLEASAIERADLLLYPTRWAAQSAIDDYGAPAEKVVVVPFGANLPEHVTREPPPRRTTDDGSFRLLLVGVEWFTKGIDDAVQAVDLLRADGVDARLTVIGCQAPGPVPEHVTVIDFIDKSTAAGLAEFRRHFERSHLFVLPSRAEAYGIVLAEAAAFGLPVVARATGGIPEVLPSPATARTFPEDGGATEFAEVLGELWAQPEERERLRLRARERFETTLNWDAWGRSVAELVRPLLA